MWNNSFLKALWLFLSCVLGVFAFLLIILFFAFFGCAYEFSKCYLEKLYRIKDEENEGSNNEEENEQGNNNNDDDQEMNNLTNWNKFMLVLIIMLGILCQPVYLLIYLLYALMECYRRFNCWFYYID